jgi:hypothetical protein
MLARFSGYIIIVVQNVAGNYLDLDVSKSSVGQSLQGFLLAPYRARSLSSISKRDGCAVQCNVEIL